MKKLTACLALTILSPWAMAQAPVFEPMPEGSHDGFVGLGLVRKPNYSGSGVRHTQVEPMVQVAWSQGGFISGSQAGWHLGDGSASHWPRVEWGPLLALQAPRNERGEGWFLDSPGAVGTLSNSVGSTTPPRGGRLQGLDKVPARLEWGGFFNLRLTPSWRLTQTLLAGGGREGAARRWNADLYYLVPTFAEHHSLTVSLGVKWANAAYEQAFFGVTPAESVRSSNAVFQPRGGLMDAHVQLRWNWALTPQWVLSTGLQASRLRGDAARSPLAEQAGAVSGSTALVYRF